MTDIQATRINISEIVLTGIKDIDDQHAQLVQIYNRLLDWTERGRALAATFDALKALEAYIGTHFAFEEAFQARIGFPGRDDHHASHVALSCDFERYSQAIFSGEEVADQFLHFVSDWIKFHISAEDMTYVAHYFRLGQSWG